MASKLKLTHYPLLSVLDSQQSNPNIRQKVAFDLRRESRSPTAGQIQAFAELKQVWSDLVPKFRILCLSELNDVTSMWQHYADSYRGAVIEFECIDELESAFLIARPVIYQDSPPGIADKKVWARCMLGRTDQTYRDLFTEHLYVKTSPWSYEREWRIVSFALPDESGLFSDYSFHPRELSRIYLGKRCSEEDQKEILCLLAYGLEHVSAYRARLDGPKTKFGFQRIR